MFWTKPQLPVTPNDQEWTEDSLLWICDQFGEEFLKTISIKTPTTKYFDRKFKGTEEDAIFAFEKICAYMSVDPKTIYLSFYGQQNLPSMQRLPHNVRSDKTPAGLYTQWPEGYTEISLNLKELEDPISVIGTLAHEIAHVKLLGEKRIAKNNEPLTDLLAIAFGFGIFSGNSVFKMKQWQDESMQGWSMSKKGYLPEQIIAYAMAWMACYQGDKDCHWKKYLNKTMLGFFETSMKFIQKYPEKIRFAREHVENVLPVSLPGSGDEKPNEGISYDRAQFAKPPAIAKIPLPEISGKWSGVLLYGKMYKMRAGSALTFSMELTMNEEDEFEGTAMDISGVGLNPDGASIAGFVDGYRISFIKKYKSSRVMNKDHDSVLRENKPGPEICYSGLFNPFNGEYEGEWTIEQSPAGGGSGTFRLKKGDII